MLSGDTRGIDAAIWRREDVATCTGGFRRKAPVLAVEVAGKYDVEEALLAKGRWYIERGTALVWLLFPRQRTVTVLTADGTRAFGRGQRLPPHPALPGLEVAVAELFEQVSAPDPG